MIDYDREIETIDGRPARCVCRDMKSRDGVRYILLVSTGDSEFPIDVDAEGRQSPAWTPAIRNKPRELVGYLNIYPEGLSSTLHESRSDADASCDDSRIACVRVVVKEGTFDT